MVFKLVFLIDAIKNANVKLIFKIAFSRAIFPSAAKKNLAIDNSPSKKNKTKMDRILLGKKRKHLILSIITC